MVAIERAQMQSIVNDVAFQVTVVARWREEGAFGVVALLSKNGNGPGCIFLVEKLNGIFSGEIGNSQRLVRFYKPKILSERCFAKKPSINER